MKFIFGLGNYGRKYARTRHNLGMRTVKEFARRIDCKPCKKLNTCVLGRSELREDIITIEPRLYMNESGKIILELMDTRLLNPHDLIVAHDDLDLSFSRIKIKTSGGSAGHKGIQSIINALGTDKFVRVRMGIGKPDKNVTPTEYVLQQFSESEEEKLEEFIERGIKALNTIIDYGVEKAMNEFNKKEVKDEC